MKIISLLMENGADVFMQTDTEQETVFHYCAAEGNVTVLREILSHLHSGQIQLAANKQSQNGWSPLGSPFPFDKLPFAKIHECAWSAIFVTSGRSSRPKL